MVSRLLVSFLFLVALNATASEHRGYLVAITDFTCPACQSVNRSQGAYEAMAEKYDLKLRYAPIPRHGKSELAYSEMVYYSVRESLPAEYTAKVTDMLFQTEEKINSLDDIEALLRGSVFGVDWNLLFNEKIRGTEIPEMIVKKAIRFASSVELTEFPTFVLVMDGKAEKVPLAGKMDKRFSDLESWLDEKFKKGSINAE